MVAPWSFHQFKFARLPRFRVRADAFTTNVDVSWNEAWTQAPQIRFFRFVGMYLEILSACAPNPVDGKTMGRGILEWKRET